MLTTCRKLWDLFDRRGRLGLLALLLAAPVVGRAKLVVSGDDDLLVLRADWKRIPIMTPAKFEEWLEKMDT